MNQDRIEGNWTQCKGKVQEQWGKLTGDDLDIIEAELEAQYQPGPRHDKNLRNVKADTGYDIAKDVCIKDAKAARTEAKADAKKRRSI